MIILDFSGCIEFLKIERNNKFKYLGGVDDNKVCTFKEKGLKLMNIDRKYRLNGPSHKLQHLKAFILLKHDSGISNVYHECC